jgi:hypothetical protein
MPALLTHTKRHPRGVQGVYSRCTQSTPLKLPPKTPLPSHTPTAKRVSGDVAEWSKALPC